MKKSRIYLRIILMFVIPLIMYQVPKFIRPMLGDWKCKGSGDRINGHWELCNFSTAFEHSTFHHPVWHFGFGHYLWILMGLTLFIVQFRFLLNELMEDL